MKKNQKRHALLMSALSLLLCVSMLVGTTFAWFTDEVTSGVNIIAAGNLDVELYHDKVNEFADLGKSKVNEGTLLFTDVNGKEIELWEPGVVAFTNLKVANVGTLALKYQLSVNSTKMNTVKDSDLTLEDALKIAVVKNGVTGDRAAVIAAGDAAGWTGLRTFNLPGVLNANETSEAYGIVIYWQPSAEDNLFNMNNNKETSDGQPLSITLGVNLFATQQMYEDDSFGTDYDKDAWVDGFDVFTAQDLQAAINNGETAIDLMADIEAAESIVIPEGATVALNLNGKTLSGAGLDAEGKKVHTIVNNGTLALADGTVESTGTNGGSAIYNNGVLTMKNVKANGAPSNTATGTASYAVNTQGANAKLTVTNSSVTGRGAIGATKGAKVEINGGTYHVPFVAWGHAVYADGEGTEVVINGGSFSEGWEYANDRWGMYQIYSGGKAKVTINGGDFSQQWDCANGYDLATAGEGSIVINGGTFAEDPSKQNNINYVAPGYKVVENNGTYVVAPENVDTVILTAADLKALSAKSFTGNNGKAESYTIMLGADIDMNGADFSAIIAQRGDTLTFIGNGHTISNMNIVSGDGDNTTGQASMFYAFPNSTLNISNLTLKNITVNSEENGSGYASAVIGYCEGKAVLNNVDVINATVTGAKSSGMLVGHLTPNGSVTATDCDLSGSVTLSDYEAAGHYAGKYIGTLGAPVVLKNCTINATVGGNLNAANLGNYYGRVLSTGALTINGDDVLNTIKIGTLEELKAFANDVNVNGNSYSGKTVILTANIDLNNEEWTPIGQTGGNGVATYFQGRFDGNGYTISNLKITNNAYDEGKNYAAGFFGFVDAGDANIVNLTIDGANVNGHHWTGVVAGYLTGNISDCTVKNATVTCTHANNDACGDKCGVIVGYVNSGSVSNCTADTCTVIAGRDAGQIVGASKINYVTDCVATNVTVTAGGDCTGANIRNEIIGRVL